jgi:Ca2+/H+ antiporter, TMEM165/GDT1 family
MFHWTHSYSAVIAAFLGSFVDFVEALTIVLAVGITRGWKAAITGTYQ